MGAADSNGIWKYDSSDIINTWPAYGNLLANTVSNVFTDIRPKAIYTASSQSDANTKAAALKTSGLTPSTAAPFFFWRSDTSSLWAYNNSTWINSAVNDTGWKASGGTIGGNYTAVSALEYRIIGKEVYWRGQFRDVSNGGLRDGNLVVGVNSECRPSANAPLQLSANLATPVSAYIISDGTIRVSGNSSHAWPILGGSYPVG